MTYQQLKDYCDRMTPEQLAASVTIHLGSKDEFFPVDHAELVSDQEEDRLEDGHPILVVLD